MSRYDRAALAGKWVAQEARKASSGAAIHDDWKARQAQQAGDIDALERAIDGQGERLVAAMGKTGPLHLAWPPSGNHSVQHAQGGHHLTRETIAYRQGVADACARHAPIAGRYCLRVHLSPPDKRARDIDNALKNLFDALVKARYLPSDSMQFMRELRVTVDDERRGRVTVVAMGMA